MTRDRIKVLDEGYVEFIDGWGNDEMFIEAARMSTGKGFEGWEKDAKLLAFLYKNKHMTPFEMGGLHFEVKAPIFVFREWHRHRVPFSYNEMSARYIPLPNENYLPTLERLRMTSATNKQAQGTAMAASTEEMAQWLVELDKAYRHCESIYQNGLSLGVPKEVARAILPVARYSRMRVSGNIRGWMNFLELRMAPNAQWEIRQYAQAVHQIFQEQFPRTAMLFDGAANGG